MNIKTKCLTELLGGRIIIMMMIVLFNFSSYAQGTLASVISLGIETEIEVERGESEYMFKVLSSEQLEDLVSTFRDTYGINAKLNISSNFICPFSGSEDQIFLSDLKKIVFLTRNERFISIRYCEKYSDQELQRIIEEADNQGN